MMGRESTPWTEFYWGGTLARWGGDFLAKPLDPEGPPQHRQPCLLLGLFPQLLHHITALVLACCITFENLFWAPTFLPFWMPPNKRCLLHFLTFQAISRIYFQDPVFGQLGWPLPLIWRLRGEVAVPLVRLNRG